MMLPIQFDGKVWKQGNSLIVTIPREIRRAYDLKEDDILRISAILMDKTELKKEEESKRLKAMYPYTGEGSLLHKNDEVAKLDQIRYYIRESRGGGYLEGDPIEKLPKIVSIRGIILKGRFMHIAYDKKHYGPDFPRDYLQKRHLGGTETIKLKTPEGKELKISRIDFESDIIKGKSPFINNVNFRGYIENFDN